MALQIRRRLFTVNEFMRMLEDGILNEDERIELLEGELASMSPIGSRHAACVKRINALLSQQVAEKAILGVQDPVQLSEYSLPQPDLSILRIRSDFYADAHPQAQDTLLVIEVADSSTGDDRLRKLPLYAAAGVPEVWIVDLPDGVVDCYAQPSPEGYRLRRRYAPGDEISPTVFAEVKIAVAAILGL